MHGAARSVGTSLTPNHHFADYRSHRCAAEFSHDIAIGGGHHGRLDPEVGVCRMGIDGDVVLRFRPRRPAQRCKRATRHGPQAWIEKTDEVTSMKRKDDKVHGEGNYKAAREFDAAQAAFVKSGRVDQAARDAAPKTEAEAAELARAEQAARERAREEDPALLRKAPRKSRS